MSWNSWYNRPFPEDTEYSRGMRANELAVELFNERAKGNAASAERITSLQIEIDSLRERR